MGGLGLWHYVDHRFQHWDVGGRVGSRATLRDHRLRLDIRRPDKDGEQAIPVDYDDAWVLWCSAGLRVWLLGLVGSGGMWGSRVGLSGRGLGEEVRLSVGCDGGVCLGALAKLFGSEVVRGERAEFGFVPG